MVVIRTSRLGILHYVFVGVAVAAQGLNAGFSVGRALLGGAESFISTGAVTWGLVLAGPANAGRVIAWMGMAMFAALAFGAPIGIELYSFGGFLGVAVATTLVTHHVHSPCADQASSAATRHAGWALEDWCAAVWMPGVCSAFSTIGFGAMIGFSFSLIAATRG